MSTQFVTEVDVEIYDDLGVNNESKINRVAIKWVLELEMREWGVKSTIISIPDQQVELFYTVLDETGEREVDQSKVFALTNVQAEYEDVGFGRALVPQTLEFSQGKISLVF